MLSFWESQSFVRYDYIVLGSGIVGLSTAISLAEKKPSSKILVLERGHLPTGASTKNAGFACFGSATELLSDLTKMSEADCMALVKMRWEGLGILRKRLGDAQMGYLGQGGYELIGDGEAYCLDKLPALNQMLAPVFGEDVFEDDKSLAGRFGFDEKQLVSIVKNKFEGQINTGEMMRSLLRLAQSLGITLVTGAEATGFEETSKEVIVSIKGFDGKNTDFRCGQLAVCTNAFTKTLCPELEIAPGRGQVLITKPIPGLKLKGTFHIEEGYYYFRDFENRVLFGGGRNLDFEGETTTEFGVTPRIMEMLEEKLSSLILPGIPYEIDQVWAGIMAFGQVKKPILQRRSDRVALGVRMGGMGVAIGSKVGGQLADMLLN